MRKYSYNKYKFRNRMFWCGYRRGLVIDDAPYLIDVARYNENIRRERRKLAIFLCILITVTATIALYFAGRSVLTSPRSFDEIYKAANELHLDGTLIGLKLDECIKVIGYKTTEFHGIRGYGWRDADGINRFRGVWCFDAGTGRGIIGTVSFGLHITYEDDIAVRTVVEECLHKSR
jgi:hypothetical protein